MCKRILVYTLFSFILFFSIPQIAQAQCSMCTKTAQQLGEGPAKGLNGAIAYLAFIPLALIGTIGYRWWKSNRDTW